MTTTAREYISKMERISNNLSYDDDNKEQQEEY